MRRRAALVAFAVQAATLLWLTWPLLPRAARALPDTTYVARFDALLVAWALAHESRALIQDPGAFADAGIYHPAPRSLFYGEGAFGALPLFLPAFVLGENPTLALNLVLLLGTILTAAALHWVAWRWTDSHLAGAVAGWTFVTTPWVLSEWLPAAPNYAVLPYLPVILHLAARPEPGWRRALGIATLAALQGLSSVYVAAATLIPLGLLALGRVLRPATRAAGWQLAAGLGLAAAVITAAYAGYFTVYRENPDLGRQTLWRAGSVQRMDLPGDLMLPWIPTGVAPVALGLIALGLASLLARRGAVPSAERRGWRQAGFWVVVGVVLALPPRTYLLGLGLPLPQALLAPWLPFHRVLRESERLGLGALMGLALLAGLAAHEIARRLGPRLPPRGQAVARGLLAGGVLALLVQYGASLTGPPLQPAAAHLWSAPYPLRDPPRLEPAVGALLRQPGGPILELPMPLQPGGAPWPVLPAEAMYRAIAHRRRLLNGYSGYWPVGFLDRAALTRQLPDAGALAALRAATGVELIVVRLGEFGRTERALCRLLDRAKGREPGACDRAFAADERAAWAALAAEGGRSDLRLVLREGDTLVFALPPAAGGGPPSAAGHQ